MIARAVLRAVATAVFVVVGLTVLTVPAVLGLYVDGQNRRMGPETAPTLLFIAIGVAAVAVGLSQIDTTRTGARTSRPARPPAAATVQVLLTSLLLGLGIAVATLLWRLLSVPDGGGPGLWNDYLHSPSAMVTLGLAVVSTANVGLSIGSLLAGATRLAVSCAAGVALLVAVLAAPAGFLWLQGTETGPLLLVLLTTSALLTTALSAGCAWLRSRGALLRSPASSSGSSPFR